MADEELRPLVDCNSGSWRDWRNRLILAEGADGKSWCNTAFMCGSRHLLDYRKQDDQNAILVFSSESFYHKRDSSLIQQFRGQLKGKAEFARIQERTGLAEYLVSVETLSEIQQALLKLLDYFIQEDFYEQPRYGIKVDTGKVGIEFTRTVAPGLQNFTDIYVWVGRGGFPLGFAVDMRDFRHSLFEWLRQDEDLGWCASVEEELLGVYFSLERDYKFADKIVID